MRQSKQDYFTIGEVKRIKNNFFLRYKFNHDKDIYQKNLISENDSKKILDVLKIFLISVFVFMMCVCILIFPESSANGVRRGIIFSSEILIPSLFPFMILSSFIVKSSLAERMGYFFDKLTMFLFKVPGCAGSTILLGLIGGYPTGARGVRELIERKEITLEQGERLLRFAVGAGPAFVVSVVGVGFLGSSKTGVILFVSQIMAAISIGMVGGIFSKKSLSDKKNTKKMSKQNSIIDLSSALVSSCSDSTICMMNMCVLVILFSCFLTIINDCGISNSFRDILIVTGIPENTAKSLLPILLEVTEGCSDAVKAGASMELLSFAIGWAGSCVHFQIFASLDGISFSKIKFIFFRLLHGFLAAFFSHVGFFFFPQARNVMNTISSKIEMGFSTRTEGSIALILLCVCFLISSFNDVDEIN